MKYSKEWYAEAAQVENQHVRAVILKKEHPEHERAFEVANRAREMAARSLGEQHPEYAVALQNMGLYFVVFAGDTLTAGDYFDWARAAVGPQHPALAETFYWLGVFYYESKDAARAEEFLEETLTIQRRYPERKDSGLARTLKALAYAKAVTRGPAEGASLLEEALAIQEASLPADSWELEDTRRRLEVMRRRAGQ